LVRMSDDELWDGGLSRDEAETGLATVTGA